MAAVIRTAVALLRRGLTTPRHLLLAATLALSATADAAAGEPRWVQRHYGSVDGLPVGSATSARIDGDGFLWLATHDGLARFDGQQFEVYDSARFPAMSGNRVQSLHTDPQGRLYAHSAHGDWLTLHAGRVEPVPIGDGRRQHILHVDPASLCLTSREAVFCPDGEGRFPEYRRFPEGLVPTIALPGADGALWLLTANHEVWLHGKAGWERRWQTTPGTTAPARPHAVVDARGVLWAAILGRLLQVSVHGPVVEAPLLVSQLWQDAAGTVWTGAVDGIYHSEGGVLRRVFSDAGKPTRIGYRAWQAPDGTTWATRDGILWRLPALATNEPLPPAVLRTRGQIQDLLFGQDGTVWVMTLRDGIHRLSRARVELLDLGDGAEGGNVYGISRAADGTMWMGTLDDGLKSIDPAGVQRRHGAAEGLPGRNPWLVAAAPDGSIYVGTYAPGLRKRPPGGTRFEPVPLPDALKDEQVLAVAFDDRNRLWLGTTAGAWRESDDRWQAVWPDDGHRVRINALAFSERGEVWLGGSEGVVRRDGDSWRAVAPALLSHSSVRDLYRSREGALWISTDGRGLVRVDADDPEGRRAVQLTRADGLPSNTPHAVREDRNGNLWVNSNQGIFRLSASNLKGFLRGETHQLSPLVLGLVDGLTELEGNGGVQPAADFDALGRLWFPSQRGVVRFDPLDMPLRETPPHAVIDALESDGEMLGLHADQRLPRGIRNLLVRYGAADLHAGAQVRFRYRLLPQEQGWTDAANRRSAGFANLAPGRYRFELLAGNSDGIWSSTPTVQVFEVPPYWYETLAFRLSGLFALALGILALTRWRVHRLRLRAADLDRQVHARTDELRAEKGRVEAALGDLSAAHAELARTHERIEDSNQQLAEQARRLEALDRFRTRVLADVSHELRTPVMLVSLPLQELQSHATRLGENDRRRLQLALQQLGRLSGLVEQLVGLVQAESGQLQLRATRINLTAVLGELVASYQPAAQRAGSTLALAAPKDAVALFGDSEKLVTVFGNLLDNAIKYSPPDTTIEVSLSRDDTQAVVSVQDRGPGFDAEVAQRLFERFYRAGGPPRQGREGLGIGLALARELVELHGGQIQARSAPGMGATFVVSLPLGSAHIALDDLALDGMRGDGIGTPSVANARGGRLLLVEDHPDLAAYLAERLGEHLPVSHVDSAEKALPLLADDADIRLVVSDVVLPGESGLTLCRRIVDGDAEPRRPVILISAKAAADDRSAGLAAGAVAYLAKPFSFETLLHAIAQAWPAAAPRLAATPADPATTDPLLQIALTALGDSQFAIAEWAERAHLSERQLRRRVNELCGQSPQIWLREQRLLRVRQLIRSGECRTLAEAGVRCGLDNPAYLYRSYRARFGEQ